MGRYEPPTNRNATPMPATIGAQHCIGMKNSECRVAREPDSLGTPASAA